MNVAQFVHRYPPAFGGAEAWTARLSRHLRDADHHVTVWTTTALDLTAFTKTGKRECPAGTQSDGISSSIPPAAFPGRRLVSKPSADRQSLVAIADTALVANCAGNVERYHTRDAEARSGSRNRIRMARSFAVPAAGPVHRSFVITPFLHLGDPTIRVTQFGEPTLPLTSLLKQADRVIADADGGTSRADGCPRSASACKAGR